jgi:predicted kinase
LETTPRQRRSTSGKPSNRRLNAKLRGREVCRKPKRKSLLHGWMCPKWQVTISKKLAKELNATILTQDSFRLAVYDKDWWGPGEPVVFGHLDIAARALLINGTNVLIDETNTLAWRRDHWKDLGGKAFYVSAPLDVCLSRCDPANDGLRNAVKRMQKNLEIFNPLDGKERVLRMYTWNGDGFDEERMRGAE